MKSTRLVRKAVWLAFALLPLTLPLVAQTISFVSDTPAHNTQAPWKVTDALNPNGNDLGIQHVCLSGTDPSPCPADATLYGYPHTGWTVDLSAPVPIPGTKIPG